MPFHTYNTIENFAPLVSQDENLSLTLSSKNAKIFYNPEKSQKARNLICFVETQYTHQAGMADEKQKPTVVEVSNNISLLINQDDLISNVLSVYHSKAKLQGNILDFTIRKF